ncbi:hypothetical protein BZG36_01593 [Bifiguratus adelaidae]|uniref:P-type phospholipid transporter n=1 Tax=Bifiguratus adelaidae TaxID=1938954 RepID=A0A261Y4D8_9FUNG|nr:hypothetical protein BZG36_01593 [Bifiguratus adelaidae]
MTENHVDNGHEASTLSPSTPTPVARRKERTLQTHLQPLYSDLHSFSQDLDETIWSMKALRTLKEQVEGELQGFSERYGRTSQSLANLQESQTNAQLVLEEQFFDLLHKAQQVLDTDGQQDPLEDNVDPSSLDAPSADPSLPSRPSTTAHDLKHLHLTMNKLLSTYSALAHRLDSIHSRQNKSFRDISDILTNVEQVQHLLLGAQSTMTEMASPTSTGDTLSLWEDAQWPWQAEDDDEEEEIHDDAMVLDELEPRIMFLPYSRPTIRETPLKDTQEPSTEPNDDSPSRHNTAMERIKRLNRRRASTPAVHKPSRRVFVNMELPEEATDEYGQPAQVFCSNKIRTAKYTLWTFIPKNLFEQFRGIANLYFLATVILQAFPILGATNPGVAALPLIAIIVITAAKAAFEDWKRAKSDEAVNKATTMTLAHWKNVNVLTGAVSNRQWIAHRIASFMEQIGSIFRPSTRVGTQAMLGGGGKVDKEAEDGDSVVDDPDFPNAVPHRDDTPEDVSDLSDSDNPRRFSTESRDDTGQRMPYRPGTIPHSVVRRTATVETTASQPYGQASGAISDDNLSHPMSRLASIHTNADSGIPNPNSREYQECHHEGSILQRIATFRSGTSVYQEPAWTPTQWETVKVGDYVRLRNDESVPADVIILASSEPDGLCYVETKNLDGETNLKVRRSLNATNELQSVQDCIDAQFWVESEPPNPSLYSYSGVLKWIVSSGSNSHLKAPPSTTRRQSVKPSISQPVTTPQSELNRNLDHIPEHPNDSLEAAPRHSMQSNRGNPLASSTSIPRLHHGVTHEKTEAITNDAVLLRGCVLRNTDWVIGLVVYTGEDTKIMLNSGRTPSKRSKMEKGTNPHVVANFGLLAILCIVSAVMNSIYYRNVTTADFFEYGQDANSSGLSGFLTFWVTLILYQNIVPISLYISVEIVKTLSAYFIFSDVDMYYAPTDQPCIPKTWNISDDLGQIEYIFSDKTGTLTQNVMQFKRCTINGVAYGLGETEAMEGQKKRLGLDMEKQDTKRLSRTMTGSTQHHVSDMNGSSRQANDAPSSEESEVTKHDEETAVEDEEDGSGLGRAKQQMKEMQSELFENKYASPMPDFVDPKIFQDLAADDAQSRAIVQFCSALAICHTVLPEFPDPDNEFKVEYKAQSPDEAALVATARDLGFAFLGREQDKVTLEAMGERKQFVLLNVLEFNSNRKRMSVILRSTEGEGRLVLLTKGADSVIYERLANEFGDNEDLKKAQSKIREATLKHLEEFANQGLRTLCLAYRFVSEGEYHQWNHRYQDAAASISDRDEKIEAVCEEIEKNLLLMGGTAIEDRLQEGVPEAIALLSKAGIKIWVLTGDKTETAINIGFACNLLEQDMTLIIINGDSKESAAQQIEDSLVKFWEEDTDGWAKRHALVIDGETLKYSLEKDVRPRLLELAKRCKSVVCCRVSPMQKAQVVNMVRKGLKVMTLAIGDGANDVSMIQEANVGVGISGEEGRQAVMASDYAIGQFRFLSKLLLVHGRWSYLRTAEMIFAFFYKNIVWTLVLFWYQLFCGFTGTMMFDYSYITLYNLVFTSLPCIVLGVFDQDVGTQLSMQNPELYYMGLRNVKFTVLRFWLHILDAIYQSAVCFFIPYGVFVVSNISEDGLFTNGVYELGTFIAGIAVVVANGYVSITIFCWTWLMAVIIFGSMATYFLWVAIYSPFNTFTFAGQSTLFGDVTFWLTLIITFAICMGPRYAVKHIIHQYWPFDNDIIREAVLCKQGKEHEEEDMMPINPPPYQQAESGVTSGRPTLSLIRTQSMDDVEFMNYANPNVTNSVPSPAPAFRRAAHRRTPSAGSTRSDQLNYMSSGKRMSFTGFAYSADEDSAFHTYRRSVYHPGAASSQPDVSSAYAAAMATERFLNRTRSTSKSSDYTKKMGEDWMMLQPVKISRTESAPVPFTQDRRKRFSPTHAIGHAMSSFASSISGLPSHTFNPHNSFHRSGSNLRHAVEETEEERQEVQPDSNHLTVPGTSSSQPPSKRHLSGSLGKMSRRLSNSFRQTVSPSVKASPPTPAAAPAIHPHPPSQQPLTVPSPAAQSNVSQGSDRPSTPGSSYFPDLISHDTIYSSLNHNPTP